MKRLADEDRSPAELEVRRSEYELVIAVRAKKRVRKGEAR